MKIALTFVLIASSIAGITAFAPAVPSHKVDLHSTSLQAKGFAGEEEKPQKKKEKSDGAKVREQKAEDYDRIAAAGGQEYSIFVRQFGDEEGSWLPCGSIAVPRGAQVASVIFENEAPLKEAIVRTYPKLKGFEQEFEYGSNLKIYPDDPVEVATNRGARPQGLSVGNWINSLLSPVDTSDSKIPPS
eukprot:CAMPEP_0194243178 /NCGR_PEP_ID=MMETSP0158-20130606/8471_1 /TAXON_ID=33649 /ORGANISM="Thalassionema nitzschioides, Strain L26-B" /LENGTH=186 /DNA_ID=CAMNT_0038978405 /DNA_START=11 /DNA_END=571 /DNA_ORIENTATION=-